MSNPENTSQEEHSRCIRETEAAESASKAAEHGRVLAEQAATSAMNWAKNEYNHDANPQKFGFESDDKSNQVPLPVNRAPNDDQGRREHGNITQPVHSDYAYSGPYYGDHGGLCDCSRPVKYLCVCIFFLGVVTLIVLRVLDPKTPKYYFNHTIVKSFNISDMNTTLHANVIYNITANNPNKRIFLKYDGITIDTFVRASDTNFWFSDSEEHLIDTSSTPAFEQSPHEVTTFILEFKVDNLTFPQHVMSLLASQRQYGYFYVRIHTRAQVHMKFGSLTPAKAFWHPESICAGTIPTTNSSYPLTMPLFNPFSSIWLCQ